MDAMIDGFLNVGVQVAALFVLIAVGVLLTKLNIIRENGVGVMTDIVLYAVTPCVIINAFQREFRSDMLVGLFIALLSAFGIMLLSVLLAELLYRRQQIDRSVVLRFSVVFSNCGFMALPLQQAILGQDGVFYGAAFVAVFNIFMWTYGLIVMSRRTCPRDALKAIINPGIIGTLVGVVLFICSIELPDVLSLPIGYLATLNTPVPMLIIGYYLANAKLSRVLRDRDAYAAMTLRLIAIPLGALLLLHVIGVDGTIVTAMVIAAASPVAAFTTMMSGKYGHDTELSAGIVSASTLFSLFTMPLIITLAQYLS